MYVSAAVSSSFTWAFIFAVQPLVMFTHLEGILSSVLSPSPGKLIFKLKIKQIQATQLYDS